MSFPGFPLSADKTNTTPTPDDHPVHHNALAVAVNDLQAQVDALALVDAGLQTQINAINSLILTLAPPTTIVAMARVSTPVGWLAMGASYPNANALYPNLWALVPASWRSGTTLVLPSFADRVPMGGGTLGAVGGANSRSLVLANLPAHTHTHAHTHTINHDHPASATATAPIPQLGGEFTAHADPGAGGNWFARRAVDNFGSNALITESGGGTHNHTFNVPAFNGSSGGASTTVTSSSGSNAAFDTTPAHLRLNWYIKI